MDTWQEWFDAFGHRFVSIHGPSWESTYRAFKERALAEAAQAAEAKEAEEERLHRENYNDAINWERW